MSCPRRSDPAGCAQRDAGDSPEVREDRIGDRDARVRAECAGHGSAKRRQAAAIAASDGLVEAGQRPDALPSDGGGQVGGRGDAERLGAARELLDA